MNRWNAAPNAAASSKRNSRLKVSWLGTLRIPVIVISQSG
jgi:hypothetical protein